MSDLNTVWMDERVIRTKCNACGATGPMAKTDEAAKFLAVVCGWDEQAGFCPSCQSLRGQRPQRRTAKGRKV